MTMALILENTEENKKLRDTVATMALEGMYLEEDFIKELIKVSNGEKTYDELRQEIIKKYV
jgi:hypothetical protein